jgi:hypothetical protein
MSFRHACAHWDAFGHEQPGRFDVASWMRARGVSDVSREVENHHGSMWREVPYTGRGLYELESRRAVVPPPPNRLNRFVDLTCVDDDDEMFISSVESRVVHPKGGNCIDGSSSRVKSKYPKRRSNRAKKPRRSRDVTFGAVSIQRVKLDRFESMLHECISHYSDVANQVNWSSTHPSVFAQLDHHRSKLHNILKEF